MCRHSALWIHSTLDPAETWCSPSTLATGNCKRMHSKIMGGECTVLTDAMQTNVKFIWINYSWQNNNLFWCAHTVHCPEIKTWRTPKTRAQGDDSLTKLIDFNEFYCHFDWLKSNLLEKNNLSCCLVPFCSSPSFPISCGSKKNRFFDFITRNTKILPLVFCFHPDAGQSQHNCCLANS